MQNKDELELSSIDGYLGDFIIPHIYTKKPISYEAVGILIKELEKGKIKVDKARSKIIVGTDESKRVFKLDLQPKLGSLPTGYSLRGYSLIINENLEVIIKGYSEEDNYNPSSEPFFTEFTIKGIFKHLDSEKGEPNRDLIDRVENIFRGYYSKKLK